MKQFVARTSFRGWVLVAGLGLLVPAVALFGGLKGLAKTGPAQDSTAPAVAVTRQSLAANYTSLRKMLSVGQHMNVSAVERRLAPFAANSADDPKLAPLTPYTITKSATPPSGSSVGQGQIITYTITITNGATADSTAGNGFIRSFDTSSTQTSFQFNPAFPTGVMTQPGAGSAWGPCTITPNGNGTNQFTCYAGDGIGGGSDTFAANQTVVLKVDALVSQAATPNNIINDTAFFETDLDGNGVDEVFIGSNTVSHIVAPSVDLGITKFAQTAQPPLPDPQNSVLAGGNSVGMASLGSIGNEGRGNISYVLTVSNIGPANATNVLIEDQVPGGPVQLSGVNAPPQDFPVAGPVQGQPIIPAAPGVVAASVADDTGGPPVGTATTFAIGCHNFGAGALLTCRPGNNIAINPSYTPGVMPAGFQARIAYRLRVLASATLNSIVSDSARISANGSIDIDGGNNTSLTTQNVVITKADLGITKVTSNPTPTAGGAAFSYTLVVTNNGPSDARGIVVTDPMPPGVIFQNVAVVNNPAIAGYGLICTGPPNATNGTVTCTGGLPGPDPNTAAVSTSTITIVGQIVANVASGVRTNTAQVISDTQEPTPNVAPNTASVQQNIVVNAPLSITKSGPATVCADDTFTYHITVLNGGSSTALNATISDPLPANTTFLNLSGTGGFETGCAHNGGTPGTVTCAAVNIPTGQSTLDITVKLAPTAPSGALANTATITSAGTGTIAVGTSTSTATVNHCSDLEITKDDSPDTVFAGQDINYTLTVKNVGPGNLGAGEFVVNDAPFPPTGTTLKSGTVISAPGFNCNLTTAFPCTATSALSAGGTTTIKYTVTVNANFNGGQPGGRVTNTATVNIVGGANAVDPISANNSSTTNTPISPSADLSVQKSSFTLGGSAFDSQVTAGGPISAFAPTLPIPLVTGSGEIFYGLQYRNDGPGDAINVHIRDVLPANVQFVAGSIVVMTGGPLLNCTFSPLSGQLDCSPAGGTLPATANGMIQFRTRVLANVQDSIVIRNTANINSEGSGVVPATPDSNSSNNTSNETQNRVRTEADLAITKSGPPTVNAGANITYTLTVTNNGVSDAQNVVVKDTLPANVSFVSASSTNNQFVCAPDNGNAGVISCTAATLIANDPNIIPARSGSNTSTITLIGRVAPTVANATVLANNATVSATTSDPVLGNNAAGPVNTTVSTNAPLSITKQGPANVCASDTFTYHLTVNNGGVSTAQNATISDPLPANTTFLNLNGTGAFANSCSHNGGTPGTVTCTGDIPAGQTTLDITVRLAPGAPSGNLPNTATITSAGTGSIAVGTATSTATVGTCAPSLSIGNVTVTEGTGGTNNATFVVTMAAANTLPVTVDYVTSDISASAPGDYSAQAGTLTFAPGVTTRNIVVPIMTDSLPEPTETFLVTLFNPANATIGTAQGTGTINDDDASGVFQFSAATASVNENAVPGSINLTINRTGDTTGVASVNFETSDITALQKTDYTFNSGNVQFGPGVISRTVNVLIVNDALVEGAETFRVSLSNASGNFVVNGNTSIVVTINDDDLVPAVNPIDNAGFFVRQQYLDFLGREPDASGLAFWTNQITICGADPACILDHRVNVSGAFFLSIEFQETSGNVIRSQRVAFARQSADPATRVPYLQFMRDTRQVGAGVIVGQAGWEAVLEANKQAYAQQVVSSPAFNARFPVMPAAAYVDALYASAGVTPTTAERTAAINAFGAGALPGRVAAFRSVADSATVRTAEFRTSFVLAEYFGYLRRNPTDAPDFNDVGYQFWLTKLNLFNGSFQQAEMVKAFITSLEYRGRFGTP